MTLKKCGKQAGTHRLELGTGGAIPEEQLDLALEGRHLLEVRCFGPCEGHYLMLGKLFLREGSYSDLHTHEPRQPT